MVFGKWVCRLKHKPDMLEDRSTSIIILSCVW
jgi:hypothetical protein